MASEAGVNPNTMQRALQELEREGLVYSQRTSGRYVTEEMRIIEHAKEQLAEEQIRGFLEAMRKRGYQQEEILSMLVKKEDEHADS